MRRFEFPDWVPMHMRHTADAVQRLNSLLSTMPSLREAAAGNGARAARIWKIRHLCHQIDSEACVGPLPVRLAEEQVAEVFKAAAGVLRELRDGERPPSVLIAAIHTGAASCISAKRPRRRSLRAAV